MSIFHIELPSAAATERSVGVVVKNNGDLEEEDEVRSRTVAFAEDVTKGVE
jgi:hypothetical protein